MKKILTLIFLSLLSITTFAAPTIPQIKNHFIKEDWKLIPNTGFIYTIENPTHSKLRILISMNPTTKTEMGDIVPSAPIEINCGGTIFYMDSSFEHTVCET